MSSIIMIWIVRCLLLAAWVMLEPRLRPALILLPVAGMTGVVTLLWQQSWL